MVQGIAFGSTRLTVSASGYATDTEQITVDPSGFAIEGGNFSVTTTDANHGVIVESARLARNTFAVATPEPLRPGVTVDVVVTSSSPGIGAITDTPVRFDPNTGESATDFDPIAAGTSTTPSRRPQASTRRTRSRESRRQ